MQQPLFFNDILTKLYTYNEMEELDILLTNKFGNINGRITYSWFNLAQMRQLIYELDCFHIYILKLDF